MIDRKHSVLRWIGKQYYALRSRLLFVVLFSLLLSLGVYVGVHSLLSETIKRFSSTDDGRERSREYVESFRRYVADNGVTEANFDGSVVEWLNNNRYVVLSVHFPSGDRYYSYLSALQPEQSILLLSWAYPAPDDVSVTQQAYPVTVTLADDTVVSCSVNEYTWYRFDKMVNVGSLAIAIFCLSAIMLAYSTHLTERISRLAEDAAQISAGDMSHEVRRDRMKDEISNLTNNIEQMRTSLVSTVERERAARAANKDLITSVSHDIRTPLTILLGYLDVMKMRAEQDPTMEKYLLAAEKTANRLKDLSDDMFQYFLAFADQEEDVSLQQYHAATLLDQMLTEHIFLMRENGYEVESDEATTDAALFITTDPNRLMRIVDNIFSNLSKYADKAFAVVIRVRQESGMLVLEFENMVRFLSAPVESTGIGLRTCHRMAEMIGAKFVTREEANCFIAAISVPLAAGGTDGAGEENADADL